jgi:hypothetical protein
MTSRINAKRKAAIFWSNEEDEAMQRLKKEGGKTWEEIAASLPVRRSAMSCQKRYANYVNEEEKRVGAGWTKEQGTFVFFIFLDSLYLSLS